MTKLTKKKKTIIGTIAGISLLGFSGTNLAMATSGTTLPQVMQEISHFYHENRAEQTPVPTSQETDSDTDIV
ncbi:hypothetical protein HCQ94_03565 [Actinomyces sp. zg-332]|uniref:hypothetical protein n=1 Tax=Actinomyces sp. zg-332 TaxID=2708340 RepID=UPI00141DEE63|nr:hypothetical protein [Actinomyces sp. zg-332]QPK93685.1 hypothetical protein HCQ94_03565 [Actinomyces sp. zg-332]